MTRMKNFKEPIINSATGIRTRIAWMRAKYSNQLDYSRFCWSEEGATLPQDACILSQHAGTAVVLDIRVRCTSYGGSRDQDEEF